LFHKRHHGGCLPKMPKTYMTQKHKSDLTPCHQNGKIDVLYK
jgi:hypothetical protein